MTLDLDDLESKAKAATPGPWKCVAHVERLLLGVQSADGVPISVIAGDRPLTNTRHAIADNAHIAAANPATMLALTARIRELEARLSIAEGLMNSDLEAQYEEATASITISPSWLL